MGAGASAGMGKHAQVRLVATRRNARAGLRRTASVPVSIALSPLPYFLFRNPLSVNQMCIYNLVTICELQDSFIQVHCDTQSGSSQKFPRNTYQFCQMPQLGTALSLLG